MKRPPEKIIDLFGSDKLRKASIGNSAITFIGDEVVIQARDKEWLPYGRLLWTMSQELSLPGLGFLGEPVVEEGYVWTCQRRLSVVKEIYPAEDASLWAHLTAEPVFQQLDYLEKHGPTKELSCLKESASTRLQMMKACELKAWAEQECPIEGNPARYLTDDEPESEIVFSHGDPSIKNTLVTASGPVLIDFEAIALLPRHKDYVHMNAFLLKRVQGNWDDLLFLYWPLARKRLPDWKRDDWRQAVLIYLLRELLDWPLEEKENLNAWRKFATLSKG